MRAARDARGYRPRSLLGAGAVGRIASALFLRTHARGERVYLAMLSARLRRPHARTWCRWRSGGRTSLFVAAVALFLVPLRLATVHVSCAIHAHGIRHRYPNGHVALDGVDLHVPHGERIAILGPNGAGKTTLMLRLNGLLTGEGELEVAGVRVGAEDAAPGARRGSGSSSRTPTTSCSCRRCARTSRSGRSTWASPRAEVERRVADALARRAHGRRRRPRAAPALARPAAARRDRHRDRHGVRRCSSSTSRPPTSTPARGASCSTCWRRSSARSWWSRTTCRSPPSCASARSSSRAAASSPTAHCREVLGDEELLAANDLELPAGFVLDAIEVRPRPVAADALGHEHAVRS